MSTLRVVPARHQTLVERVAATVRAEMARAQITQQEMAAILGVTQSMVSKRLLGKQPFRLDEIEKIAAALGVHPATLLGGNAPLPPPPTTGRYSRKISTKRNALPTSRVVVGTPRELAAVA